MALICDWLTGMRGGERCLEAVCELYPDADIFTLVHFPGSVSKTIESHNIHTSYIQQLPGNIRKFRRYLPLFGHAIRQFDLSEYDCVLSFSHCVAKGVKVRIGVPHICYCYTPMRYAWHMRKEYLNKYSCIKKWFVEVMLNHLKYGDKKNSSNVTNFIAISKNVQDRISQAYNRDSVIIYPPVKSDRFAISQTDDGYYLIVSALVPYKRINLAVQTFSNIKRKLLIVGNGPELGNLRALASTYVTFVENASDDEVVEYMRKCSALIFPGEEDFGIVPLEAQACGKPVIAFAKGGALETVVGLNQSQPKASSATGVFFYEQNAESLCDAIQLFEEKSNMFDANKCRDNAIRFDHSVYKQTIQKFIEDVTKVSN